MIVPPEFILETIIQRGLAAIAADTTLVNDLFIQFPAQYQTEAAGYFTGRKVAVTVNWPREGLTLPVVSIINSASNEDPSQDAIGNIMGERDTLDTDSSITQYEGIATQNTYSVFVQTKDPRETIYLCLAIKALFLLNVETMLTAGMQNIVIDESDLRFSEEMAPELQNPRVITLRCLTYFTVPRSVDILRALTVTITPEMAFDATEEIST